MICQLLCQLIDRSNGRESCKHLRVTKLNQTRVWEVDKLQKRYKFVFRKLAKLFGKSETVFEVKENIFKVMIKDFLTIG